MGELKLVEILDSTGFEIAYSDFKEKPKTPFIAYLLSSTSSFMADNVEYLKIGQYRIELYTDEKNEVSQRKLEQAFEANEIIYEKDEAYIESERLFLTTYDIEWIISEEESNEPE